MKESSVLFSASMVRSILDGRKTMTRRVLKLRKGDSIGSISYTDGTREHIVCDKDGDSVGFEFCCPYGYTGDRLWVRETWATSQFMDNNPPSETLNHGLPFWFKADKSCIYSGVKDGGPSFMSMGKWRPSIHMPRWASRITLEITNVRIERLQDITEDDAKAEGVEPICAEDLKTIPADILARLNSLDVPSYICGFYKTWVSLYGHEAWWDNPFMWVVKFKRIREETK